MRFSTRTRVIVINGVPQSGKDTFVDFAYNYCETYEMANVLNLSSVDLIKGALASFGWDGTKSENVRDIIAGIKKIWVEADNGPTMFMINNIINFHMEHNGEDNIIFCHIREPEEIDKLRRAIYGMESVGIEFITILISRKDCDGYSTYSNESDNPIFIKEFDYDHIIHNDGDLEKYESTVHNFIDELLGGNNND
jgi:hypothetical protein